MQETEFISRNKDKWQEFEEVLSNKNKDPERLTDLFIETSDDLSYSRTYYSKRSVRVYLNSIAQQVYQAIYKNKKKEKNVFMRFWREELPAAMWYCRKQLLFSFLLFMAGVFIGMLSSMYYPEFARIILGDSYIEMTEANIKNGDPMGVYKDEEPVAMFLKIGWNNIMISFGTFVLGITFGIGTVYIILFNSIMVGAFLYFFIERDLFRESFLAIMLHGTLELSMIVVAGCAGFVLARGLIFPGTYTRGQALMQSARNGIKIMIGVTVLLIYAAIIESFATRYTEMHDAIRGGIILLSAIIVGGYFVWYPSHRFRLGLIPENPVEEKPMVGHKQFELNKIKNAGRIFTESFELFSHYIRPISIIALVAASILTIYYGLIVNGKFHEIYYSGSAQFRGIIDLGWMWPWASFNYHLNFEKFPSALLMITIMSAAYSLFYFRLVNKRFGLPPTSFSLRQTLNSLFILAVALSPLMLPHLATVVIEPIVLPVCLLWLYCSYTGDKWFFQSLGYTLGLLSGNFWKLIGVFMTTMLIQWITYFLISSDVAEVIIRFVKMNIPRNAFLAEQVGYVLQTWMLFFIPAIMLSLTLFATALVYHSMLEKSEASSLKASIEKIGFKKRVYGLEHEA